MASPAQSVGFFFPSFIFSADVCTLGQGSDFCTVYVRKTDTPLEEKGDKRPSHDDGRLPDEIRFVKFSNITWTHDSKGFFYQVCAPRK